MKIRNKIITYVPMVLVCFIFFVPIWMVFVNSFKTKLDAMSFGLWFPETFQWENYFRVIEEGGVARSFLNGLFLAFASSLVAIIINSMASFFIARSRRAVAKVIYYVFLSGIIIPVALIPTYIVLFYMKLIDKYFGLIFMFVTLAVPFGIFLYTGFIKTVSREMDEAAIVDGCGKLRLFFQVIFPLLKPVTVTQFIFGFIGVWNDIMVQLFFANPKKWSMPMTVYNFYGKYVQEWNVIFADIVITVIPILILYVFAQKYIVSGMTAGAVKG